MLTPDFESADMSVNDFSVSKKEEIHEDVLRDVAQTAVGAAVLELLSFEEDPCSASGAMSAASSAPSAPAQYGSSCFPYGVVAGDPGTHRVRYDDEETDYATRVKEYPEGYIPITQFVQQAKEIYSQLTGPGPKWHTEPRDT